MAAQLAGVIRSSINKGAHAGQADVMSSSSAAISAASASALMISAVIVAKIPSLPACRKAAYPQKQLRKSLIKIADKVFRVLQSQRNPK